MDERLPERQRFGVLDLPSEVQFAGLGALLSGFEHVGINVGDCHASAATRHPEGDVASAPRHVEDLLSGARLHAIDEAILP